MSRGPGIREIFSSKSMARSDAFQFENQESKQQLKLSKKKEVDVQSPMKKFGGYKPKILSGETDFLEIQAHASPDSNTETSAEKSRVSPDQFQEPLSLRPQPVSSKPWVIGDKNVPMVLGSTNNDDDDGNDNVETPVSNIYESANLTDDYSSNHANVSHRTLSISSETSTLVRQDSDDSRQGIDNPIVYANDFISNDDPVSTSALSKTETDLRDFKTNGVLSDDEKNFELAGVFIPAPDYEEDEKTLDFNSEDTDDLSDCADDAKPRKLKPKTAFKIYEGADLSHFLNEDEQQGTVPHNDPTARNKQGKNSKTEVRKINTNQKQSLYKQLSTNKNKRKNNGNVPTFNSVRSFSYADSKFGTKGKAMGKSLSSPNLPDHDDSQMFLSATTQESSYESFLKSRHADDLPSASSNGLDNNEEIGQSVKLRHKDDPVWKKLTVRLKHRLSKSVGAKEQ